LEAANLPKEMFSTWANQFAMTNGLGPAVTTMQTWSAESWDFLELTHLLENHILDQFLAASAWIALTVLDLNRASKIVLTRQMKIAEKARELASFVLPKWLHSKDFDFFGD